MARTLNLVPALFLISLLFISTAKSSGFNTTCCSLTDFITENITDTNFTYYHCLNILKNTTYPIARSCDLYYKFDDDFYIDEHGGLILQNGTPSIDIADYCEGIESTVLGPSRVAVLCVVEEPDTSYLAYCMIVSVIFLLITALIYAVLPELRDLEGKSIINFCTALALGLAIFVSLTVPDADMNFCAARGFLAYFFLIAAFFWSNVLSIQVLMSTRRPQGPGSEQKEFLWYAAYAWTCPALLTVCMAIVNFHPGDHQKPGLGLMTCWFYDTHQQWYYMYSVMTLLLALNLCIFIYIANIICRHTFTSSHIRALKYKFTTIIRLVIAMGLPWVFEMLGSFSGEHIVWSIFDVLNSLQGLFVFLLLVIFRKRSMQAMYKHGWLNCISGPVERCLANREDDEQYAVQTDLPMNGKSVVQENDYREMNNIH